ncbi:MAG TPA: hypothetical protein DD381_13730 [Lentisphaeria bacterium]|nr:MAG: hypothetical protein A2X47_13800 [Lentisphaerae bacterium GWF2_38_69]HBM17382.1 hypothetical protein [Lentisphaeria bacterium]
MAIYENDALILAPLAGYTDIPYRLSARRHGCVYAFTEMVDVSSIVYVRKKSFKLLERDESEKWLGVQLVGRDLEQMSKAVDIVNEYNFDVLDFNMGCPTPKVAKKGKGAGLAKEPELACRIIEAMIKKSRIPVTAKIRIQDENNPDSTIVLAKKLEAAGIQALTIHGRTYEKMYLGSSHPKIISAVRENLKIQVIANGGAFDKETYDALRSQSGCSAVMLARGAMGNPWLFEELLGKHEGIVPTDELVAEMRLHIGEMIGLYGEKWGMKMARKIAVSYVKGRGYGGEMKNKATKISTWANFEAYLTEVERGPSEDFLKQHRVVFRNTPAGAV